MIAMALICGVTGSYSSAYASDAKKEEVELTKKTQFLELTPLVLPVVNERGINQVVSLVISIQVPSESKLKQVTEQQPRLQDAYIQGMYGMLNEHAALKGGVLQVGMIKDRLNKISKRVMGDGVVDDVLLQVVQQHKI